jgi:hypothetical protein
MPSGESRDEWLAEDPDMKHSSTLLIILGGFNIETHD